ERVEEGEDAVLLDEALGVLDAALGFVGAVVRDEADLAGLAVGERDAALGLVDVVEVRLGTSSLGAERGHGSRVGVGAAQHDLGVGDARIRVLERGVAATVVGRGGGVVDGGRALVGGRRVVGGAA